MSERAVAFTVNGVLREACAEPRMLLSDFIRHRLKLTGTHVGCEHGVCGACTILLDGQAIRSCLMFAVQADGASVTTVEGLAEGGELTAIQQAFRELHALQCGYCTPGFLMSITALLSNASQNTMSEEEIRTALSGNLCRCTGYQNIVRAVRRTVEIKAGAGSH